MEITELGFVKFACSAINYETTSFVFENYSLIESVLVMVDFATQVPLLNGF